MKNRPKLRRFIFRLLPFGLIWLISGLVFLIVELAATGSFSQLPDTAIRIDFEIFLWSSIAITTVGLLIGFIEIKYLDYVFTNQNFVIRFICKLLVYSFLFLIIIFITYPLAVSLELNTPITDHRVWDKYYQYFTSVTHLSTALQLATALVLSLFYTEISEFIGQGVLLNFVTGKYHKPVEEERIFMFVDMKSSTSIAEQLGHQKYFRLLRAYYACFSEAIIQYEGEIYQYVGDEIILSWKYRSDQTDRRCIDCFFAMQNDLNRQQNSFWEKYGLRPSFKAGLHYGKVTTGEIGDIKKEILFTGDVLNATARIQSLCNTYNTNLLASVDLVSQLNLGSAYRVKTLGAVELRGKTEKKQLCTLTAC